MTYPPEIRNVVDAVRHLVRALRLSARQAERQSGLSFAQLFVLQKLGDEPALSLSDLAERTSTDQSSVSVVVRGLTDLGYVSREKDPRDARKLVLGLTRKGRDLLKKSPPMAQDRLIQAVANLPSRERLQLALSLNRIIAAMDVPGGVAPMFFEEEQPDRGDK